MRTFECWYLCRRIDEPGTSIRIPTYIDLFARGYDCPEQYISTGNWTESIRGLRRVFSIQGLGKREGQKTVDKV